MMRDLLIFPAIVGCLVVAIIFNNNYLLIFLLMAVILRILFLQNIKILFLSFFVGMILAGYTQLAKIPDDPPHNIDELVISPDKIKVSGDLLSGTGSYDGYEYKFFYRIKSQNEKLLWQKLDNISVAKIKVKKIEKINSPRNPGEFDYAPYLEHHKIKYSINIDEIIFISPKVNLTFNDKINVSRIHLIKRFSQLPKWLRIHADSLILGYNTNEEPNFLHNLSILGVIHLFSLSGLHVLIMLSILRKICSCLKITRETIDTFMLVILPIYAVLVGSKPGIWRAIILSIVGISLHKFDITLSKLDVFGITAIICLFINPFSMMDMGGQLSFLLSLALLFLYDSRLIMNTIKMNLVSLPIIIYFTFQFSWLILLANIIFVPIFTYIILPITIISAFTVNAPIWQMIDLLFEKLYSFINTVASNNDYLFVTGTIPLLVIFTLIVLSLFIAETKQLKSKYLVLYVSILSICILFNKYPIQGRVSIIDVGQGDSILVTTPIHRRTYLIDTGGKLGFPKKDWQKREQLTQVETSTIPYLKRQGISKIDKVFLSHKDVDHIGNLNKLVDKFPVKEINFGTGLEQNKIIVELMANNPQIRFNKLKTGDKFVAGKINWNVLWPKVKSIGENGDSLTLLANINGSKWLFTGDLDIEGERKIIADQSFKVDYLKVGHHGSKTSSSDAFIKYIDPKLALISAGVNNRYGHPNKETIDVLDKNHVEHLNTADYGMIVWYYYPFSHKNGISTFLKGEVVEDSRVKK